MTLPRRPVTNGLLTLLRTSVYMVGDGVAPDPAGQQYAVLEPLSTTAEGSTFSPEREYYFEYRLRSVGTDQSSVAGGRTNPRMDAEAVDDALRAVLFNRAVPLEGTGWRAIGRTLITSSTDREGATVNVITDISLLVVGTT